MALAMSATGYPVLAEIGARGDRASRILRDVALVAAGVVAHTLFSKIAVPIPASPVPVTMGTFVVLAMGAAYGPRLGLITLGTWMLIGAVGFDVFLGSPSGATGLAYMMGMTGGYLGGYVLSTFVMGAFARRGWDRSVGSMALAMLLGNVAIYVPGLLWMHHLIGAGLFDAGRYASAWDQALAWGLVPFLLGDALKLALAALLLPGLWALVDRVRR